MYKIGNAEFEIKDTAKLTFREYQKATEKIFDYKIKAVSITSEELKNIIDIIAIQINDVEYDPLDVTLETMENMVAEYFKLKKNLMNTGTENLKS